MDWTGLHCTRIFGLKLMLGTVCLGRHGIALELFALWAREVAGHLSLVAKTKKKKNYVGRGNSPYIN
eukprot:1148811-Pelagomonas_calceolata.AAC.2